MKHIVRSLLSILVLIALATPVYAMDASQKTKSVILPKGEIVNHDYFAAGDTVTVSGIVNGDAYVAGGTVTVNGTVNGDLFVAGGTVHIDGTIAHDLRAAGGTVIVTKPIAGNVTAAGGNVTFSKDAKIAGSILAGAGTLEILSPVGKGITAGAGMLTLGDRITGSVKAGVGNLTMLPDARVSGDLTYWSEHTADITAPATVSGTVVRHDPPKTDVERELPIIAGGKMKALAKSAGTVFMVWKFIYLGLMFLLGLAVFTVLPVFTEKTVAIFIKRPMRELGIGLLTMIGLPIAGILLGITIVALPLSVFVFAAMGLVLFAAHIYAGLATGTVLFGWFKRPSGRALTYLVGLVTLFVLSWIPFLGGLAKAVIELMAVGALMTQKYALWGHLRTKRLI